ncbi:MAG TPA: histidine phosphatase family protein, partial [Leptospiraceae bacterium]|nr:histidine phosphatase family protein [Leptospiraceae bacterium]
MKPQREIYLFRHGYSRANALRHKKLSFQPFLLLIRKVFGFSFTLFLIQLLELFKTGTILKRLADKDIPLEQIGILQSELTGKFLANRKIHPDLILCSDFLRTRETTQGILKGIQSITEIDHKDKIIYSSLIVERDGGIEFGYPLSYYPVLYPKTNEIYKTTHRLDFKPPMGESIKDVRFKRIPNLIYLLNQFNSKTIFIVGHGITNSAILSLLTDTELEKVKIGMENLGVYHLIEDISGKWLLDPNFSSGQRI